MHRIVLAAALGAALVSAAAPATAQVVGGSIAIGEPGFYGRLDLGSGLPPPQLLFPQPVVIAPQPVFVDQPPLYLRVPPEQARHWRRYCMRYGACGQRVFFVRDDWYSRVYAPAYRERHGGPPFRGDFHDRPRGPGFEGHDDHGRGPDRDRGPHDRLDDHGRGPDGDRGHGRRE